MTHFLLKLHCRADQALLISTNVLAINSELNAVMRAFGVDIGVGPFDLQPPTSGNFQYIMTISPSSLIIVAECTGRRAIEIQSQYLMDFSSLHGKAQDLIGIGGLDQAIVSIGDHVFEVLRFFSYHRVTKLYNDALTNPTFADSLISRVSFTKWDIRVSLAEYTVTPLLLQYWPAYLCDTQRNLFRVRDSESSWAIVPLL